MDIHPDRHTSRHQDTQISGQTDIHLDIKTHTDIQMDGPTYRQTDDRHIDGQTDIQPSRLARCVFKQSSQMTPFMSLSSLAHIYKVI